MLLYILFVFYTTYELSRLAVLCLVNETDPETCDETDPETDEELTDAQEVEESQTESDGEEEVNFNLTQEQEQLVTRISPSVFGQATKRRRSCLTNKTGRFVSLCQFSLLLKHMSAWVSYQLHQLFRGLSTPQHSKD